MKASWILPAAALIGAFPASAQDAKANPEENAEVKGYPPGVSEIRYPSTADGTEQPSLFWKPEEAGKPAPLLVALHTWSGNYRQAGGEAKYAEWCQKVGWVFIHPHFRGPNWTPDALGSDLTVADIRSAVDYAKANAKVDETRIYCVGVSGGGHASLLMAGRAPEIWAGISAWCGISDIGAWHDQCSDSKFANYAGHIEKALGGPPESDPERLADAKHRSPLTWLAKAGGVPLDINHGIQDGRTGSVPFTHSLHAYNAVVPDGERIAAKKIEDAWIAYGDRIILATDPPPKDALYGGNVPLIRHSYGNTRVTIFDGGHEINHNAALNWLAAQRKGKPANWAPPKVAELKTTRVEKESGK